MKHEHDGWLYLMHNDELIFQTVDHAERNGGHSVFRLVWRVRNDWDYTRALEIAGRIDADSTQRA